MTHDLSEAQDWESVLSGGADAFGRIFDRHRSRVFRHSLRLVGNIEDARDVVAMTFLEAWRRRRAVRAVDGTIIGWLLATATNVSRNPSVVGIPDLELK